VGHGPARADIVQAAQQSEQRLPSARSACQRAKYIGTSMVARKRQVARNADDRDANRDADETAEVADAAARGRRR
jgi:hypothetical protein